MSIKTGGFAKSSKINGPKEYQPVFKSSCRSVDEKFLVLARKNNIKRARLGLTVSKKKISKAVKRNQIKRAIRESFRHHNKDLMGLDVVVVVHKKQTTINNKMIIDSLSAHWKIISICRKF